MSIDEAAYWVQFWTEAEETAFRADDTEAYERAYFNRIEAERTLERLAPGHVTDGPVDTTEADRVQILIDMDRLAHGLKLEA